jgi:predicted DNA-binding transcriptional regulator
MEGFTRLADASSMATRSVELRRLTDRQTRVYQAFIEELGNIRVPKMVELVKIANRLGISYKAARCAKNALVKKGFLQQWTTTFKDPEKGRGFFRKATYYRVKF